MWNSRTSENSMTGADTSDRVHPSIAPVTEMPAAPAKAPTPSHITQGSRSLSESSLGKSIVIKGEIVSSEPLYICGTVDGSISAPGHRITIGTEGKVKGDIDAREVVVMGEVHGDLTTTERVEIRKDGSLTGDISTARISLEDGAHVLGSIDICPPAPAKTVESEPLAPIEEAAETLEVAEVA